MIIALDNRLLRSAFISVQYLRFFIFLRFHNPLFNRLQLILFIIGLLAFLFHRILLKVLFE